LPDALLPFFFGLNETATTIALNLSTYKERPVG
jgi:hypothetical protein